MILPSPGTKKAKKTLGNIQRKELGRIYNGFIESYNEVFNYTGEFFPSIFFIYSDNSNKESGPIAFPINSDFVRDPKKIYQVLEAVARTYPEPAFTLEMMMYANMGADEQNGSNVIIFGAKDAEGHTIHTLLTQKESSVNIKWEFKKIKNKLHEWVLPSIKGKKGVSSKSYTVTDTFLNMLTTKYTVATSMINQKVDTLKVS